MAAPGVTLGDLKTRIILETARDDLGPGGEAEVALTRAITRAITYYSDEEFWFNRGNGSLATAADIADVTTPSTLRIIRTVSHASDGFKLTKVPLAEIEYRLETGRPTKWAENEGHIHLWPAPDGVYSLNVYGIAQVDPPTTNGQTTIWTIEAYDLIAARVRFLLCRDVFRDTEGAQLAKQAEGEELSRLRKETRRRSVTGRAAELSAGGRFNINIG